MEEEQRGAVVKTMRLQPASRAQLSLMLRYMEQHEEFFQGKITKTFTASDKKRHWEALALKLNSQGDTQGKSAGKWQRTWVDWRHSVKKKAREIRKQRERGFQTKTLSPLEIRGLKLIRKLPSTKFPIEGDLKDLGVPEVEEEESLGSDTTGIEPVKIEDVLCISENSNASSCDDFFSGASISSPSPKPLVDPSPSIHSCNTAVTGAVSKAPTKDSVPCVVNSVYVVSTKTVPPLALKKASSSAVNAAVGSSPPDPPNAPPLLARVKQEVIDEVDISDNAAASESPTTQSSSKDMKKTPLDEGMESSEDEFERDPNPPKRRTEDTLGGLPLSLQNSILERLDTLNRNIETNTCALTILAKAVNDSADMNMRAASQLAKSLNKIGNMVGSYMESLRNGQQEK